jgi:hypothetical protein
VLFRAIVWNGTLFFDSVANDDVDVRETATLLENAFAFTRCNVYTRMQVLFQCSAEKRAARYERGLGSLSAERRPQEVGHKGGAPGKGRLRRRQHRPKK